MLEVADSELCNGCHACYSICPVQAIDMQGDSEGFIRPKIDTFKCIACHQCEFVCPVLKPVYQQSGVPQAYACKNNDEGVRQGSSSGGIFSLLAQDVLDQNGYVAGAAFTEGLEVSHIFVNSTTDISPLRGSKYVQSRIGDAFKECKKYLDERKPVLFSGTPCQIGGLKSFLGMEYVNLTCIDIICHGVPSPLVFKKYTADLENRSKSKIKKFSFRDKSFSWKKYSVRATFDNKKIYCHQFTKDAFMRLFLDDLTLRPSCYRCHFKTLNRISDITLADFWGIQNIKPLLDDDKGISLVVVHSDKGEKIFRKLKSIVSERVELVDAVKHNTAMIKSAIRPKWRGFVLKLMKAKSFGFVYSLSSFLLFPINLKSSIKRILRKTASILGVIK